MLEAGWGGFPAEIFVRNALALPRAPAVLLVHADQPRKQKRRSAFASGKAEQVDRAEAFEPLLVRTKEIAGGKVCPPLPRPAEADLVEHYGRFGMHSNSQVSAEYETC